MSATLNNMPVLQHQNQIGVLDGREAVGGDQGRFTGAFLTDILNNPGFGPCVNG